MSPTGLRSSDPINMANFRLVVPNPSLCTIPRVPAFTNSVSWPDWNGTAVDCLRECQYDPACTASMFSSTLRTCVKAVSVETYDSRAGFGAYVADNWITWTTQIYVPYFNVYCAAYDWDKSCALVAPACGWNKGLVGYNQAHPAGGNGYCGLLQCPPVISTSG